MKRFVFSLENLLRHKKWLEDEAKRLLGVEMHKLNLLEDEFREIKNSRETILAEWSSSEKLTPMQRLDFLTYCNKLQADIESQQAKINVQEIAVEEKTRELNAAMMERKKIEKFKERSYGKYKKYKNRKEAAVIDEVASNFKQLSGES